MAEKKAAAPAATAPVRYQVVIACDDKTGRGRVPGEVLDEGDLPHDKNFLLAVGAIAPIPEGG